MSPAIAKKASTRFGRYDLVRRIGAGGMGEVWLARLPGTSGIAKVCVVKKILPHLTSDRVFVERFLDEAKVVVHLAHGNIAQVFEMGEVNGAYFMAMEYVEGMPLGKIAARLRKDGGPIPVALALYIGTQVLEALAYAHRRQHPDGKSLHLVHRDISPSNILITFDGEVKVIDFGAAQSSLKETQTAPRIVIGNLTYMSPEQARKRPVDGRADLYSTAVVLWELLAWQCLPTTGEPVDRWKRAAYPKFSPPSRFRPDLPPGIDPIVMRALAEDPRDRYANAGAMLEELQRALVTLAPGTGQATLATFMQQYFSEDARADREVVADALSAGAERTDPSGLPFQEEPTDPRADAPTPTPTPTPTGLPSLAPILTPPTPTPTPVVDALALMRAKEPRLGDASPHSVPTRPAPPAASPPAAPVNLVRSRERTLGGPDDVSGFITASWPSGRWVRSRVTRVAAVAIAFGIGIALAWVTFSWWGAP